MSGETSLTSSLHNPRGCQPQKYSRDKAACCRERSDLCAPTHREEGRGQWRRRKERRKEGKKGRSEGGRGTFPLNLCFVSGPGLGGTFRWARQRGQGAGRSRAKGREREAARGGAGPLESCYCLRSLLREAPSKKSLLERARLETSGSQRASEPCEMT